MVTRTIKEVVKEIKNDERYKRLRKSFDTLPMYQLPTDQLLSEVETLHKMREIRRLNSLDPGFTDALIKANTNDQSCRGRLTEIIMTCVKASSSLEDAIVALRYHLLLKYSDQLRSYRTKEERVQVVNKVLQPFMKYTQKIGTLKEITQLVVSDIDKGAWSLRTSIEAVQLHVSRERNI